MYGDKIRICNVFNGLVPYITVILSVMMVLKLSVVIAAHHHSALYNIVVVLQH